MEDLQLVFALLGGVAILAVLVHGIWSIRRQQGNNIKDQKMRKAPRKHSPRVDSEGFDEHGIGEVRVVKGSEAKQSEPTVKQEPTLASKPEADRVEPVIETQPTTVSEEQLDLGLEPKQAGLFDDEVTSADDKISDVKQVEEEIEELPEPYDVLVLHVVAKEGEELKGAELLPSMLTVNFKFGEMNIFHRHENPAGTGNVLFSIANMVNPGTFDLDNMEQFSTPGIVLFMRLPCHGDALRNFSTMLNSAEQLADDLGAELRDGERQLWNDDKKQDYIRRIKS
ncbi:cell division protein ZipA [Parashewanella curva]|uniref:Cell division protein ZipA n=1 Tax=Parashewanella curva TaxID=2338552 RepID=A0A3L8PU52_9GAMM|nr:cell division protein ZipA [Parashewanella curva]RLV58834.1 cell division protein ZipA [Parashewanella curva]